MIVCLFAWVFFSGTAAFAVDSPRLRAEPLAVSVSAGGRTCRIQAYRIDGSLCFSLSDTASLLNGSRAQFSVAVDSAGGRALATRGVGRREPLCELAKPASARMAGSQWSLFIDGCKARTIVVYDVDGDAYLDARDLACLFGFGLGHDRERDLWTLDGSAGYPLRFDKNVYRTGSVTVDGKKVPYRLYTEVYVSRPNAVAQQFMKIYVPLNATSASPIFMPLNTGGYMHVSASSPQSVGAGAGEAEEVVADAYMGPLGHGSPFAEAMKAAAILMSKGFVVVSPAARGRDTTVEQHGAVTEVGNGPACPVDLKAAVRYLKFNDGEIPGDSDRIIVTGMSGGGAMTSVMGATGGCSAYDGDLEELGAAPADDSVFAAAPYCPIADLDNSDMAYEWMFYKTGADTALRGGRLSESDLRLAAVMAKMYAVYVDELGFADPRTKQLLSLGRDAASGSYRDYFYQVISASATKYFRSRGFVNEDGRLNEYGRNYLKTKGLVNDLSADVSPGEFLSWNDAAGTAALTDYAAYARYMGRLKPVGAFDNGMSSVTGENDLFNLEPTVFSNDVKIKGGWSHFDPNLGEAVAQAGLAGRQGYESVRGFAVPDRTARAAALIDPMYFIADYSRVKGLNVNKYAAGLYGSSRPCKYWRIRTGSVDRDTSQTVTMNLALALAAGGASVDYELAWGQPHSGWYDRDELIGWILSLPGCGEK